MITRFIAEDFRRMLDKITEIQAKEPDNKGVDKDVHISDLLTSPRTQDLSKEKIRKIGDLIDYLDQFSELAVYRDINAQYDDAYYSNVPIEAIASAAGLSTEDIRKIANTAKDGSISIDGDCITIFGND